MKSTTFELENGQEAEEDAQVKCKCGAQWPAMTTIEAYRNYLKANKEHPGRSCEETRRSRWSGR